MIKRYFKGLIFTLLMCGAGITHAATVPADSARDLAAEFFAAYAPDRQVSAEALELAYTRSVSGKPLYYVFNTSDGQGYIIMSADDCASPVLGYSLTGRYDSATLPPAMKWMLQGLENEVKAAPDVQAPTDMARRRNMVRRAARAESKILLKTPEWSQEAPFNSMIPGRPLTGCVGAAMAMIMKYHNHPPKGFGSYDGVSFDVAYDWPNMRMDNYRFGYSQTEADAVATLVYHAAHSIGTQFGYSGSSAYEVKVPAALVNYFDYDRGVSFKKRSETPTQAEFDAIVENEIRAGRPVLYCGQDVTTGHAFVVDGYDPASHLLHINWGWGGATGNGNGGWFASTALNPTVSQTHNFNNLTTVIYNIKPGDGQNAAWSPLHITADARQQGMTSDLSGDLTAGKEFTVRVGNIKNVSYNRFSGKITVALFSADGSFKTTLSKIDGFSLDGMAIFQSGYADFRCSLPEGTEVAEGDMIRMATSADDGATWQPMAGELLTANEIPARGAAPAYFSVSHADVAGATFEGEPQVIRGWNYRFKVIAENPSRDVVTVKANGVLLTPDAQGFYTVRNVLEDQELAIWVRDAADVREKRSVWVGQAGTLEKILSGPESSDIKDLTLFGTIDARDFAFIRKSMKLTRLDMQSARVAAFESNQANAIPREAFRGMGTLKEILLPGTINRFNNGAFRSTGLTSIVIPRNVSNYEYNVFLNCSSLRDVWVNNPNPVFVNWCVFNGTPKNRTVHCPGEAAMNKYKSNKYWNQPEIDANVQFVSDTYPAVTDIALAVMENDEVNYLSDTEPGRYEKGKTVTFTAQHMADDDNRMEVYANSTLLTPNAEGKYSTTLNANTIIHFNLVEPIQPAAYASPWKLTDKGGTIGLLTDVVNVIPDVNFTIRANSFSTNDDQVLWAAVLTTADGAIKEFISPISSWQAGAGTGHKMNITCCVKESKVREGNLIRLATSYNNKTWALVEGSGEGVVSALPALNNQTPVYNFTFPEGLEEKANVSGFVASAVRGRDLTFKIVPKSPTDVVRMTINGVVAVEKSKSITYSFIAKEDLDFNFEVTPDNPVTEVVFDLQEGEHLWSDDFVFQRQRRDQIMGKSRIVVMGKIDKTDFDMFKSALITAIPVVSVDLSGAEIVADRKSPASYPADEVPPYAFYDTMVSNNTFINAFKDIKFPASVRSIATDALYGCAGITEIELPLNLYNNEKVNGLTHVGGLKQNCFSGCKNLKTIYCYATPAGGNVDMVHHIDFNGYQTTSYGFDYNDPWTYPNKLCPDINPMAVTVVVKPEYWSQYSNPKNTGSGGWINGWVENSFHLVFEYPVYGLKYDVTRCFVDDPNANTDALVDFLGGATEGSKEYPWLYVAVANKDLKRPAEAAAYNPDQKFKVYANGELVPANKQGNDGQTIITFYNPNNYTRLGKTGDRIIDVVYLYDVAFDCASADIKVIPDVLNNESVGTKATEFQKWNIENPLHGVLENVRENSAVRFTVASENINAGELSFVVKHGENTLVADEEGYYSIDVTDSDELLSVYAVPRNGATLDASDLNAINAAEAKEVTSIALTGDVDPERLKEVIDEFPVIEELDLASLEVALPAEAMAGKETLRTVVLPQAAEIEPGTFRDCVNLTNVEVPASVNSIGENAFSGCSSLSSLSFTGITGIGANAFEGCDNLTSIVFNSQTEPAQARARRVSRAPRAETVDPAAFAGLNPNCLIYLDENETVPADNTANYIKVCTEDTPEGRVREYIAAGNMQLDGGYPFNAINSFSFAEGGEVSMEMPLAPTPAEGNSSWSRLVLPFAPVKATDAEGNGMILYDGNDEAALNGHNYMTGEMVEESTDKLLLASEIKANRPYVVALHPDTKATVVRFSGNAVSQTPSEIRVPGTDYALAANFVAKSLPAATTYLLDETGSSFAPVADAAEGDEVEVAPFSVYAEAAEAAAPLEVKIRIEHILSGVDGAADGSAELRFRRTGDDLTVYADTACELNVYDLNGILVRVLHLQPGANTVNALPEGIYVIDGIKTRL